MSAFGVARAARWMGTMRVRRSIGLRALDAPAGRRGVATGGASESSSERNPWERVLIFPPRPGGAKDYRCPAFIPNSFFTAMGSTEGRIF
jgi:hypothetical protein